MIRWFKKESRALRQKITTRVLIISLAVIAVAVSGTVLMADWTGNSITTYTMGLVGIGTSSPARTLDIKAGAGSTAPFIITTNDYNYANTLGSLFVIEFGAASGNTYTMLGALYKYFQMQHQTQ
jgi:hypothetical protein